MADALDPAVYLDLVRRALAEDHGGGDATTRAIVAPGTRARGLIITRAACVVAGLEVAREVFRALDPAVAFTAVRQDGERCASGDVLARVEGSAAALLTAERTALNFLQRLTGIATLTRRYVDAAGGALTILDTRKTTPTLRALEKYAVRCGGGASHRASLSDAILIKDNHIRLAGGLAEALRRVRAAGTTLPVEVEAQSLHEVDEALAAGADVIMLDNLDDDAAREAVTRIAGRARVELSGGITLDRLPALAALGAACASVGALTHSAPAADLSFEIE